MSLSANTLLCQQHCTHTLCYTPTIMVPTQLSADCHCDCALLNLLPVFPFICPSSATVSVHVSAHCHCTCTLLHPWDLHLHFFFQHHCTLVVLWSPLVHICTLPLTAPRHFSAKHQCTFLCLLPLWPCTLNLPSLYLCMLVLTTIISLHFSTHY